MANSFELTEQEVLRNRVLVAEQGRLSRPSTAQPEEDARQAARARTRDLEFAWASFLESAMRAGAIPESDPRLLTLAVLGLYTSIWHWYRPTGIVALEHIGEYFTQLALAMVGASPDATPSRSGRPRELLRASR